MPDDAQSSILYVEDEKLLALATVDAFEHAGFTVIHAVDGAKAIAVLESDAMKLSALVTDIRLPGGIDGWQIGHRARELNAAIPVVYVSADSAADWPSEGVPNSLMLQKPFAEAQLLAAVTTLLNQAAGQLPAP